MGFEFKKATKHQAKLRLGLIGPSGSGKTYTSLRVGSCLGKRIAFVDTEHGSASKYADEFSFDVLELDNFDPRTLIEIIGYAESKGYDVLIVDSLSHFWTGTGGMLDQVDRITARSKSGNSYTTGWREMSPVHNQLVDRLISSRLHIICTMRAKTEYVLEDNGKGGKVPRKVGMAPVQRDGMEYEFDVVGDLDWENKLIITKTRCRALAKHVIPEPGEAFAEVLKEWLYQGEEPPHPLADHGNARAVISDELKGRGMDKQAMANAVGRWLGYLAAKNFDATTPEQRQTFVDEIREGKWDQETPPFTAGEKAGQMKVA